MFTQRTVTVEVTANVVKFKFLNGEALELHRQNPGYLEAVGEWFCRAVAALPLEVEAEPVTLEEIAVGFRLPTTTVHPSTRRAVDVINYEVGVLGHDIRVAPDVYALLDRLNVPAAHLVWVYPTYKLAVSKSPDQVEVLPDLVVFDLPAFIIGRDDEGGILVWQKANAAAVADLWRVLSLSLDTFLNQRVDTIVADLTDGSPLYVRDLLFALLADRLPTELKTKPWVARAIPWPDEARIAVKFEPKEAQRWPKKI